MSEVDPSIRDNKGRFVAGNPGGPGGNKRLPMLLPILREKLAQLSPDEKRTNAEAIVDELIAAALDRDEWAVKEIMNRVDGKVQDAEKSETMLAVPIRLIDFDPDVSRAGDADSDS